MHEGAKMTNGQGYDLIITFVGHEVRVFLCNGAVLSGELKSLEGKHIRIKKSGAEGLEAVVNLDHMVSITKV